MKQATGNVAISVTGLIVKAYMVISIVWSKADNEYRKFRTPAKGTYLGLPKTAQPAI